MSEDFQKLLGAAREAIETDRALTGGFLMGGTGLPAPVQATPPAPQAARAAAATPTVAKPAASPMAAQPVARSTAPAATPPAAPNFPADSPKAGHIPLPVIPNTDDPAVKDRAGKLAPVEAQVRRCVNCRLCETRTNTVFGEGNPAAQLMFIGEAPGQDEDEQGRPFVGKAGELLTKMIGAMGLTRGQVYIANTLKCRPPGNRPPAADESVACWDYLRQQLLILRPKFIVTLGNPATHAILGTKLGINKLRGQWQTPPAGEPALAGVQVMPTFHPSYVLRDYTPDTRGKVWADLQLVMKAMGLK